MSPRFLFVLAALPLLSACPKAPPRPLAGLPSQEDQALWPAVEKLASDAEAVLTGQEEAIWKNWTEGTAANIGKTYEGKEKLFSLESIQTIDRLRKSLATAYRCPSAAAGVPPQCGTDGWGSLEVRALTYLHVFFVGEHLSRVLADQADAIANLEASLTFTASGVEHHYRDLDRLLATENDPEKRRALYLGATRAIDRLSLLVRRKDERTGALLAELGYPSYESLGESIRYGNMDQMARLAEQVLDLTQTAYAKAMDQMALRELRTPFEKLRRADIPRLFRPQNLQFFFPKDALASRAQSTLSGMGIDLGAMKNITLDLRDLPHKNPRPLTVLVAVPGDVRVSLKPSGGARDQAALFHELGFALRFASARNPEQLYPRARGGHQPHLRFELTRLGSAVIGQASALLFEQLVENPDWLQQYAGLSGEKLESQVIGANAHRLFQLRRRAGKLLYDIAVYRGEAQDARAIYRRIMSRAYGLPITAEDEARYIVDRDELYQPADDIRAWLFARQLQEILTRRFGASWWNNPLAGDLLRDVWSKSSALYPQEVPNSVGETISPDELLRNFAAAFTVAVESSRQARSGK
jgi:hypothetical protein